MIQSMTGYGSAENGSGELMRLKVEVRSVNHRYLDVSIRMPREIQALEDKVRRQVQQAVSRGRVDVYITWKNAADDSVSVILDQGVAQAYKQALAEMCELCSLEEIPGLDILSRLPDVFRVERAQVDLDEIWTRLDVVMGLALDRLVAQRKEEGERLAADFRMRLDTLEELAGGVQKRAPLVVEEYRKKLEDRLREYLQQMEIDPARILTETAIFADRSSVAEELVRLASHITAFRKTLKEKGAVGRKLDFLTQELFREINTIGSKANDYEVTSLVVDMKTELEKIREQVQNIE